MLAVLQWKGDGDYMLQYQKRTHGEMCEGRAGQKTDVHSVPGKTGILLLAPQRKNRALQFLIHVHTTHLDVILHWSYCKVQHTEADEYSYRQQYTVQG